MKKYFIIFAGIVGSMFSASCSSNDTDEIVDNNPKIKRFYVDAPLSSSRAAVDGLNKGSVEVQWEAHDEVNVWGIGHSGCERFTFKDWNGFHSTGVFEGNFFDASKYFLMYPYQSDATFDNVTGIITATIPIEQHATLGSFDPKAAICTGATESKTDESITLNHACSFFQITVPTLPAGRLCKSITVTPYKGVGVDVSSWKMSGKVTISTNSTASKIESFTAGASYVKLVPPAGQESFGSGTYLLTFACSTHFPGIAVDVEYTDGTHSKKEKEGEIQVNSKTIYNLGEAGNGN